MSSLVLRKYYYLDEDFINSAYSDVFGYVHQEEEITKIDESKASGKVGVKKIVEAEAGGQKTSVDTIKFSANKTVSAKLQDILNFLKSESGEDLPYYEQIDESIFQSIQRDELFEGVFKLDFTKIEKYALLAGVATSLEEIIGTNTLDDKADKALLDIQSLAEKEREQGLTCILHFINDKKYPCYCRIDESFLKIARKSLQGEVTVICKVTRKIQPGATIDLTDLTELTKIKLSNTKTRKGRQQQVQQIKNGKKTSLKEFQDEIKGPALEIVPIAIYK